MDSTQPPLPLGPVEEIQDMDLLTPPDELSRRHTGSRVAQVESRRDAILRALACGIPYASICEVFRVGPATVASLSAAHPESVEAGKKRLAGKFAAGAHLALDAAVESIAAGSMPAASLPVCAGIFADKSLALSGEPTSIVEHRHTVDPAALARVARAWIEPAQPALDVVSIAQVEDCGDSAACGPDDAPADAPPTSPRAGLDASDRAPAPARDATARTGGEGVRDAEPAGRTDGSGRIPPQDKGFS